MICVDYFVVFAHKKYIVKSSGWRNNSQKSKKNKKKLKIVLTIAEGCHIQGYTDAMSVGRLVRKR